MIYIYLIHVKKYFMNADNYQSFNEIIDMFNSESSKLEEIVNQALKKFEDLSLAEIIETYYQIINVAALVKLLRQNFEDEKNSEKRKSLLTRIQEMERYIVEKFDGNLHPLIMAKLKNLIENSMKNLNDMTPNQGDKTKEEVENQGKTYEKLRQIMSTKEFVDQYNDGVDSKLEN